jgi:hypothetical protein
MSITERPWFRYTMAAVIGAGIGVIVGWCTNAAMVEISINPIFALYFGTY